MQSWPRTQDFPLITSFASFESYLQEEKFAKINLQNVGRTEILFLKNRRFEHTAIIFADKALVSKVNTLQLFTQSTVKKVPEGVNALQLTSIYIDTPFESRNNKLLILFFLFIYLYYLFL